LLTYWDINSIYYLKCKKSIQFTVHNNISIGYQYSILWIVINLMIGKQEIIRFLFSFKLLYKGIYDRWFWIIFKLIWWPKFYNIFIQHKLCIYLYFGIFLFLFMVSPRTDEFYWIRIIRDEFIIYYKIMINR